MLLCNNSTAGDPLGPIVIQIQGPFLKVSLTVNCRMRWLSNRRCSITAPNLSVSLQIICSLLHTHITCSWMHRVTVVSGITATLIGSTHVQCNDKYTPLPIEDEESLLVPMTRNCTGYIAWPCEVWSTSNIKEFNSNLKEVFPCFFLGCKANAGV